MAYVTFRWMEGYMRTLTTFADGYCKVCWLTCTCRRGKYTDKLVHGRYPRVKSALDPAQILWHNLGYTQFARRVRRCFTTFLALIVVLICTAIQLYGTRADEAIQTFSPQVECSPDFTYDAESAYLDFQRGNSDEEGP